MAKSTPIKSKRKGALTKSSEVLERLRRIENLLSKEELQSDLLLKGENEELTELSRLEKLELEIKKDVSPHPLKRITYHDITKGLIGAFFGVVGHFAFYYGHHLAEEFTYFRATLLLVVSMLLLVAFLYFSGYRRIVEYRKFLPIRALVIFSTAIFVSISVLFLFGVLHLPLHPGDLYKEVAAVSILAVMGAATADLIGGEA